MYLTDEHLEELYSAHGEDVYLFLRARTENQQDALDLLAETFAQATINRSRCKADSIEGARSWIYGIATNQLNGFIKRGQVERRAMRRLRLERVQLHTSMFPVEPGESPEQAIEDWLTQINPEHAEAIRRRAFLGQSYAQIAQDLGITEETARKRVSRGVFQLRTLVDNESTVEGPSHGR